MTTLAGGGRSRLELHYEKALAKALSTFPALFASYDCLVLYLIPFVPIRCCTPPSALALFSVAHRYTPTSLSNIRTNYTWLLENVTILDDDCVPP